MITGNPDPLSPAALGIEVIEVRRRIRGDGYGARNGADDGWSETQVVVSLARVRFVEPPAPGRKVPLPG